MKKILLVILIGMSLAVVFSSCGNAGGGGTAEVRQVSATAEGPFGKYEPEINLSTVILWYNWVTLPENDTVEDNAWTRAYKDELGIVGEVLRTIDADKYTEQTNLMIASDDLPDLFFVTRNQFEQLIAAGRIEDLTDSFNNYASDFVKTEILGDTNKIGREIVSKNGRLYGLPFNLDYTDFTNVLYLREDWMNELNLSDPKSLDDVENIARLFVEEKGAVYGISFSKDFINPGFWNMFHSYPGIWLKDNSGELYSGDYTEERKAGVQKLVDWYKEGLIPKDFGVIDEQRRQEDLISDKCGIMFAGLWDSVYLQSMIDADPTVDWKCVPIPSADGKTAKIGADPVGMQQIYVIKKGYEYPEAAVKIMNLFEKYVFDPEFATLETQYKYNYDEENNMVYLASFIYAEPVRKNYHLFKAVDGMYASGDTSSLNPEQELIYTQMKNYEEGETAQWYVTMWYGPKSPCAVIDYYLNNDLYQVNEFYGLTTQAGIEKGPTIYKAWEELLTQIIMGEKDITDYNAFAENVKGLGMDEITREVNEWYKNK